MNPSIGLASVEPSGNSAYQLKNKTRKKYIQKQGSQAETFYGTNMQGSHVDK